MIAVLLIIGVVVGIGYPFFRSALAARGQVQTEGEVDLGDALPIVRPLPIAREELCPQCSRMNPPGAVRCFECGGQMTVSGIAKLFGGVEQEELIREGIQAGGLLLLMILAMAMANFLPIGGKIVLLLMTIAALGYRFMRVVYN